IAFGAAGAFVCAKFAECNAAPLLKGADCGVRIVLLLACCITAASGMLACGAKLAERSAMVLFGCMALFIGRMFAAGMFACGAKLAECAARSPFACAVCGACIMALFACGAKFAECGA